MFRAKSQLYLALIAVIMLTAAACGRNDDQGQTLGSDSALAGEATLLCSQECADRGQCGSSAQGDMVLLNSLGPVTTGHNMAVANGTGVSIDRIESRNLDEPEQTIQAPFYLVNVPQRGPAWVAGWCIGQ